MILHLIESLKRLDLFGAPLPTFNVKGDTEVRTPTGGCLSLIISLLTFAFSLVKLQDLITHKNPTLIETEVPSEEDARYDLSDSEFMVAVALEHWSQGRKDDPRYTQWLSRFYTFIDGAETKEWYRSHTCSDEEFARFYPVEDVSVIKVEKLQAEGQFKCFNLA